MGACTPRWRWPRDGGAGLSAPAFLAAGVFWAALLLLPSVVRGGVLSHMSLDETTIALPLVRSDLWLVHGNTHVAQHDLVLLDSAHSGGQISHLWSRKPIESKDFEIVLTMALGKEAGAEGKSNGFAIWLEPRLPDFRSPLSHAFFGHAETFSGVAVFCAALNRQGAPNPSISAGSSNGTVAWTSADVPTGSGVYWNIRGAVTELRITFRNGKLTGHGRLDPAKPTSPGETPAEQRWIELFSTTADLPSPVFLGFSAGVPPTVTPSQIDSVVLRSLTVVDNEPPAAGTDGAAAPAPAVGGARSVPLPPRRRAAAVPDAPSADAAADAAAAAAAAAQVEALRTSLSAVGGRVEQAVSLLLSFEAKLEEVREKVVALEMRAGSSHETIDAVNQKVATLHQQVATSQLDAVKLISAQAHQKRAEDASQAHQVKAYIQSHKRSQYFLSIVLLCTVLGTLGYVVKQHRDLRKTHLY